MSPKKAARKEKSLAEGREQITLIMDSDVVAAAEKHAANIRIKRNPLIQLAVIEYLTRNGAWPPVKTEVIVK